jgi:hypothetical protein
VNVYDEVTDPRRGRQDHFALQYKGLDSDNTGWLQFVAPEVEAFDANEAADATGTGAGPAIIEYPANPTAAGETTMIDRPQHVLPAHEIYWHPNGRPYAATSWASAARRTSSSRRITARWCAAGRSSTTSRTERRREEGPPRWSGAAAQMLHGQASVGEGEEGLPGA